MAKLFAIGLLAWIAHGVGFSTSQAVFLGVGALLLFSYFREERRPFVMTIYPKWRLILELFVLDPDAIIQRTEPYVAHRSSTVTTLRPGLVFFNNESRFSKVEANAQRLTIFGDDLADPVFGWRWTRHGLLFYLNVGENPPILERLDKAGLSRTDLSHLELAVLPHDAFRLELMDRGWGSAFFGASYERKLRSNLEQAGWKDAGGFGWESRFLHVRIEEV